MHIRWALVWGILGFLFCSPSFAMPVFRSQWFSRPLAMGEAFTAVADNYQTSAYNPAGFYRANEPNTFQMAAGGWWNKELSNAFDGKVTTFDADNFAILQQQLTGIRYTFGFKPVSWSYSTPANGWHFGYNSSLLLDIGDLQFERSTLADVAATIPNKIGELYKQYRTENPTATVILPARAAAAFGGVQVGVNIPLPPLPATTTPALTTAIETALQPFNNTTVLDPSFLINTYLQNVLEFGKAITAGQYLNLGANLKFIQRVGIGRRIKLFELINNLGTDNNTANLLNIYRPKTTNLLPALDLGMLIKFNNRFNSKIGLAALNLGNPDFKTVGGKLNSMVNLGYSMQHSWQFANLTWSLEHQDIAHQYFASTKAARRWAFGSNLQLVGFQNAEYLNIQTGYRDQQFSWGLELNLGILKFNFMRWVENAGTDELNISDPRSYFSVSAQF